MKADHRNRGSAKTDTMVERRGAEVIDAGPIPLRALERSDDAEFLYHLQERLGLDTCKVRFRKIRLPRQTMSGLTCDQLSDFDQGVTADGARRKLDPHNEPPLGYEWFEERRAIAEQAAAAYASGTSVDPIVVRLDARDDVEILDGYHRLAGANEAKVDLIEAYELLASG